MLVKQWTLHFSSDNLPGFFLNGPKEQKIFQLRKNENISVWWKYFWIELLSMFDNRDHVRMWWSEDTWVFLLSSCYQVFESSASSRLSLSLSLSCQRWWRNISALLDTITALTSVSRSQAWPDVARRSRDVLWWFLIMMAASEASDDQWCCDTSPHLPSLMDRQERSEECYHHHPGGRHQLPSTTDYVVPLYHCTNINNQTSLHIKLSPSVCLTRQILPGWSETEILSRVRLMMITDD